MEEENGREQTGVKQMEKIVLIGPVYPYKGGISHYTGLMCRALREQYDVTMVSYKFQYPKLLYKKEQRDYSSENFRIPDTNYWIHTANPLNWVRCAGKIVKLRPQAVIIQWWHPYFAPCYTVLAGMLKRRGIKVLFVCHNVFPHERFPMDRLLTKMTLRQGSCFLVQSGQDRDDLCNIIPKASFTQTPHPTYNVFRVRKISKGEARQEIGLPQDVPMLLFFGFVREYKGLGYLLEALPQIRKALPETKLYIVGDFGSDKDTYLGSIREKGLEDAVVIRDGYVPDAEVEPYFAACDLVVLPYISATQSGIVQIAYGFDKAVLVTDVGGLPEVVTDGKTGYVVENRDTKALAEAAIRYFKEEKEEAFCRNIKKEKRKYSWEVMAERIRELLERE